MRKLSFEANKDQTVGLCLDTISMNKQALVFCSSKRAAESQAEKISKSLDERKEIWKELSKKILGVLSTPTKQCKRLAMCVEKGVAFHHAGLASKQRELIEDNFRDGVITIICSTPTLAAGLDLPAFRAIIRDSKRFGQRGMAPIPVLEYLQMAGRAGRPGKEDYGEAILVASREEDVETLTEHYIHGEVEDIYSKLAVEPVLRMYVLSLVSSEIIKTEEELEKFFDKTFYAHQFEDKYKLHLTLHRMVGLLREWKFLEGTKDFATADEMNNLSATRLGKRVSEMYLDPLTASIIIDYLDDIENEIELIHLLSCSLEMRPLLRMRVADAEYIQAAKANEEYLIDEGDFYDISQDDYDDTIKTSMFFLDWMNERTEEELLEKYGIRPGEITMKLQRIDWLLYATDELARLTKRQPLLKLIRQVRTRAKHGVKTELIALLAFKGIGRVRARKLFTAGIANVKDVKQASMEKLGSIVGKALAESLKQQVGEPINTETQHTFK